MGEQLKPCPFCGSQGHIGSEPCDDGFGKFYFVKCNNCGGKSPERFANETCPIFFGVLRDLWNRRPTPPSEE